MYKTDLAVEPTESAAIERRRIMEKQRQSRIFNARQRIIGVRTKFESVLNIKSAPLLSLLIVNAFMQAFINLNGFSFNRITILKVVLDFRGTAYQIMLLVTSCHGYPTG